MKITIIGDGSSDVILKGIVKWLVDDLYPTKSFEISFADFRGYKNPPKKADIKGQIKAAKEFYPFDLLVYHRDAETTRDANIIQQRKNEIYSNVNVDDVNSIVCIVPIKMMEAWLLINADAIKKAVGKRNYKEEIQLPKVSKIEFIQEPKDTLIKILKQVSCLKGRKLKTFNADTRKTIHLVAEYINDYSPLRELKAFQIFEEDLKNHLENVLQLV